MKKLISVLLAFIILSDSVSAVYASGSPDAVKAEASAETEEQLARVKRSEFS